MGNSGGPLVVGMAFVMALALTNPCHAADESPDTAAPSQVDETAQPARSGPDADPYLEFEGAVFSLKVSLPYCGKTHKRHGLLHAQHSRVSASPS